MASNIETGQYTPAGEKSALILPDANRARGNIRETIQFGDMKGDTPPNKYNSPGVDPENPYNYFYNSDATPKKAGQPSSPDGEARFAVSSDGTVEDGDREPGAEGSPDGKVETHEGVLVEVVKGLDDVNNKVTKVIAQFEAQAKVVGDLQRVIAEKFHPDQPTLPGKEVELRQPAAGPDILSDDIGELKVIKKPAPLEIEEAPQDGDDEPAPEDKTPAPRTVELPPELVQAVEKARSAYAQETAKKRNSFLGKYLADSRYLAKVPFLKTIADKLNESADRPLTEAKLDYEKCVRDFIDEYTAQSNELVDEETRASDEFRTQLRLNRQLLLHEHIHELSSETARYREQFSGKAGAFTQWWVNRTSVKGKLAKAGVVGGTGVLLGGAVGVVGLGSLGAVAGATAGLAMGYQVTKRRANAVNEAGHTLAEQQHQEFMKDVDKVRDDVDDVGSLTGLFEQGTAKEVKGNRNRLKTATGTAAAGGGLGGMVGNALRPTADALQPPTTNRTVGQPTGPKADFDIPTQSPPAEITPPVEVALQPDPTIGSYEFPWNWAADKFGAEGAQNTLYKLGELAAQDGHAIQWNGSGLTEWIKVDGMSDTQSVLDILSRYVGKL